MLRFVDKNSSAPPPPKTPHADEPEESEEEREEEEHEEYDGHDDDRESYDDRGGEYSAQSDSRGGGEQPVDDTLRMIANPDVVRPKEVSMSMVPQDLAARHDYAPMPMGPAEITPGRLPSPTPRPGGPTPPPEGPEDPRLQRDSPRSGRRTPDLRSPPPETPRGGVAEQARNTVMEFEECLNKLNMWKLQYPALYEKTIGQEFDIASDHVKVISARHIFEHTLKHQRGLNFMRRMLVGGIGVIETGHEKFNPLGLHLEDWSDSVDAEIEIHDHWLMTIWDRHLKKPVDDNPLIEGAMLIGLSAYQHHQLKLKEIEAQEKLERAKAKRIKQERKRKKAEREESELNQAKIRALKAAEQRERAAEQKRTERRDRIERKKREHPGGATGHILRAGASLMTGEVPVEPPSYHPTPSPLSEREEDDTPAGFSLSLRDDASTIDIDE